MQFDLYARRKELGLSLEEIGKKVGVSKSTVKKWESGYIENMKRDKIALLAEVLEVSPLDIIGVENNSAFDNRFAGLSRRKKELIEVVSSLSEEEAEAVLKLLERKERS